MFAEYREYYRRKYAAAAQNSTNSEEMPLRSSGDKRDRLGIHLDNIGHGLIVLLPVSMAVANRSSPLVLACAALFVLASRLVSGGIDSYRSALKGVRTSALVFAICGIVYPLVTLAWALKPALGLFSWGEAVLPAVSSAVLIVSWRIAPPPRWMVGALAMAMLIAAGFIVAELLLNLPLRHLYGGRLATFVHNRPVVTLLLLLGPVLVLVGFHRRRMLCWLVLLATVVAIVESESEAAKLGLVAAAATFALSYAPFIWVKRLLAVVLLGLIWMQPFFGSTVATIMPETVIEATEAGNSRARIQLWQAFSDVSRRYPIFGTGFSSSPHMGSHPVAPKIDRAYRRMLKVGHPHNAFLQVWVELGAIGALFLSGLVLWVMKCLSGAPADIRRIGLVTLMTTSAIALVSHGAWQGWWIAAITLAAALLTLRPAPSQPVE
jgi:O-antigen ligase